MNTKAHCSISTQWVSLLIVVTGISTSNHNEHLNVSKGLRRPPASRYLGWQRCSDGCRSKDRTRLPDLSEGTHFGAQNTREVVHDLRVGVCPHGLEARVGGVHPPQTMQPAVNAENDRVQQG